MSSPTLPTKTPFFGALLGMGIAIISYTAFNASETLTTVKGYLASDPRISTQSSLATNVRTLDDGTRRALERNARVVAEQQAKETVSSSVESTASVARSEDVSPAMHAAAPIAETVASFSPQKYDRLALRAKRLRLEVGEHSGAPGYKPIADPISPEEAYKGKGKKGIPQPIPAPIIPTPQTIIKEVRVPVATPPQVITREIKVPTPPKTIIREMKVPVSSPPKVVVREVPVISREPVELLTDSGMGLNLALVASLFGAFFLVRSQKKEEDVLSY